MVETSLGGGKLLPSLVAGFLSLVKKLGERGGRLGEQRAESSLKDLTSKDFNHFKYSGMHDAWC